MLGRNLNAYKVLVNASRSDLMHLLNSGMALPGRERRQGVLRVVLVIILGALWAGARKARKLETKMPCYYQMERVSMRQAE